jgi:hypothetical protein
MIETSAWSAELTQSVPTCSRTPERDAVCALFPRNEDAEIYEALLVRGKPVSGHTWQRRSGAGRSVKEHTPGGASRDM